MAEHSEKTSRKRFPGRLFNDAKARFQRSAPPTETRPSISEELIREFRTTEDINGTIEKWKEEFIKRRHPPDGSPLRKACEKVGAHIGEIVKTVGIAQFLLDKVSNAVPVIAPAATVLAAFSGVFDSFTKVSEEFDKIVEFFDTFAKMFRNIEQLKSTEEKSVDLDFVLESVDELMAASIDACCLAIKAPEHRIKLWIRLSLSDDEVGPALKKVQAASLAVQERISVIGLKVSFDIRYVLVDVRGTTEKTYGRVLLGNKKQDEILERQKDSDIKNERYFVELTRKIDERIPAAQKNTNRDLVARNNAALLELKQNLEPVIDQSGYIQDLKDWQVAGASDWLMKDRYSRWCTSEKHILWIYGDPGIGKTYMSLAAIKELEKARELFASFFFRENRDSCRSLKGALSSMVLQIASNDSQYCEEILGVLKALPEDQGPEELFAAFFINRKIDRDLFLVFDGIDEAEEDEDRALTNILDLALKKTPKIHVLITSRNFPNINYSETRAAAFMIDEMEADHMRASFRVVCRARIESLRRLRKFSRRSKNYLIKVLTRNADGMLYIKNMLTFFETLGLEKDVLNQVLNMPGSLYGVYDMMLEECYKERTEKQSEILKEVFSWVAFGTRRLTLQEVAYLAKRSSSAGEKLIIQEEIRQKLSGIFELVRFIEQEEVTDVDDDYVIRLDEPERDDPFAIISYAEDELFTLQFQERCLRDYFRKTELIPSDNRWSPFKARLSVLKTCISLICDESIKHDEKKDEENDQNDDSKVSYRLKMHAANRWDEHFSELSNEIYEAEDEDILQMVELLSKLMTNSGNATKTLEDFAQWRYLDYKFSEYRGLTEVISEWTTRAAAIPLENQNPRLSPAVQEWLSQVNSEGGMRQMMLSLAKAHGENWAKETNSALAKEAFLFGRDAILLSDESTEEDSSSVSTENDPGDDSCPVEYFESFVEKLMPNKSEQLTNRALGLVFYWYERFALAIEYLDKSFDKSTPPLDRHHVLMVRSKAWGHMGEVEKARQSFNDALGALDSLPPEEAEAPATQELKRTALLRYADFETENEEIIRLLNEARNYNASLGFLDGSSLDYLTVVLEKSKDGRNRLTYEVERWKRQERSTWLKWAIEDEENTNNVITRLEKAAVMARRQSVLEKILTPTIRASRTTPVWARYRLSRTYSQVLFDVDKAEKLLSMIIKEKPTAETKETLNSARQDYVKIIYHRFRSAKTRAEKQKYIEIMDAIERFDSDDLRTSYLPIIQARMMRGVGNIGAYKEKLSEAFKVCLKGLTDDDLQNDIYAFRRLAVVLSSLRALEKDARIAYSLQYSKVNVTKPAKPRDGESGTNAQEHVGFESNEATAGELTNCGTGERQLSFAWDNLDSPIAERIDSTLLGKPDHLPTETSHAPESTLIIEKDSTEDSNDEDLNEFSWTRCNVCKEEATNSWTRPAYLCLVCVIGSVCTDCFAKRELTKNNEVPGIWHGYCGQRHKYLKGPIEGWQGVKDGMIRIKGEQPIKFQEWLEGLEEKWEDAWNDDDESFIWDIL
ncbi:hypothetical protein F4779DRAFT_577668 [Xylariaceae sp. FL0662B]|nr:hypothetical protein F4779DRAFT_577668 [Xylariaceae sp. FL0662B]